MNESDCAKKVLEWAIREAVEASTDHQKARCELSASLAAEKMWKEYNPDDGVGGFGCNPYGRDNEYKIKNVDRTAKVATDAHTVLNFVKDKICNLIKEEIKS